jgi:hypothetical protein
MKHDYNQLLRDADDHKNDHPRAKAEWQALRDFVAVRGKVVQVNYVFAYYKNDEDGSDGRQDVKLNTPALVRVHANTHPSNITGLVHDHTIDPEWTASLVEPHKELDEDKWDTTALTVFGTAYSTKTGDARPDDSIYWEQLDPQPMSPGTLEVERQQIAAIKKRRGSPRDGANVKRPRLSRASDMTSEGLKDHRVHVQNIARIIAAGLAAKASKGRTRQAVALYMEMTQAPSEDNPETKKPIIQVERRG